MFTIYALFNPDVNKIYIGQTEDLERRLKAHSDGTFSGSFTAKNVGQWKLIYSEEAPSRSAALKREKQLKSFRGREFIKKHIPG